MENLSHAFFQFLMVAGNPWLVDESPDLCLHVHITLSSMAVSSPFFFCLFYTNLFVFFCLFNTLALDLEPTLNPR